MTNWLHSQAEAAAKKELERRKLAREGLLNFTRYTMPTYRVGAMHWLICEKLEAVARGDCKRLMICTPPRHGKSELVSKRLPAWYLGQFPGKQIISASYGADLANDFGRDVRNIVASQEFRALFPAVALAGDSQAKNRWHTNQGGSYVAAGVGTATTGRGADLLNIDDPIKDRAEAESEVVRKSVWDWFASTAYTRLMPGAAIILTMTRWHEMDLGGQLMAQSEAEDGEKWELLRLPSLADQIDDPLGRQIGEALWPERYNADRLGQIRRVIGEREFGALYQQDPQPAGTSFFDVQNCLVDGDPVALPQRPDYVFAVIDTATKTGSTHDGTAVSFWAGWERQGIPHPLICLDWDIIQIEGSLLEAWLPTIFTRLEEFAVATKARMGSAGAWIEDKASGMVLLQHAARRGWPARPIDTKITSVGKDERAISVTGHVHAGRVKLSRQAYDKTSNYKGRHGNHFLMQVFRFQIGVKDQEDDLLDTFTYAIAVSLGNNQGYA